MQHYVLGFLFSEDSDYVVLIHKNRPDWQKGKLNGVGGKIEPGESMYAAMRREFLEETGVDIPDWQLCGELTEFPKWDCYVFTARSSLIAQVTSKTDELVGLYRPWDIDKLDVIPNLRFLVPFARRFTGEQLKIRY